MPLFVSDIDGTVWVNGKPDQVVADYIAANAEELVYLTNRPESERAQTEKDLEEVGLQYKRLVMNDDGSPAPEFKARVIAAMLDSGEMVDLFIDNDEANRNAVEALDVDVEDPADIRMGEGEFSDASMSANNMDAIKTSTPEQKLKAAEANIASAISERDSLRADFEALTQKNLEISAASEKAVAELTEKLNASTAELETVKASLAEASAKLAELSEKAVTVATVAAKEIAAIGLEKPLPVTSGPAAGQDTATILEQYAALPVGAERLAFFEANKRAIFAARAKTA